MLSGILDTHPEFVDEELINILAELCIMTKSYHQVYEVVFTRIFLSVVTFLALNLLSFTHLSCYFLPNPPPLFPSCDTCLSKSMRLFQPKYHFLSPFFCFHSLLIFLTLTVPLPTFLLSLILVIFRSSPVSITWYQSYLRSHTLSHLMIT